jgi:hypothetical protein
LAPILLLKIPNPASPGAGDDKLKTKTPMKLTTLLHTSALALLASLAMNAQAGTAPKAPAPAPVEPSGALFDTIGATLDVGYDTRYYFRGLWFADNTTWTGVNLSVPLSEKLSLGFGALYTTTVDTLVTAEGEDTSLDYSELDLAASLNYDAGFAKFGLVYTHYEFFDTFSGSTRFGPAGGGELNVTGVEEVGLTMTAALGPVNFTSGFYHDFTIGAAYAEVGADLPIEINSWLSLVPAVKMGYGFSSYYTLPGTQNTGLTHLLPTLSAPIKLTDSATLVPYVAYNISLDTRHSNNTTDTEIFGGVKLSVAF